MYKYSLIKGLKLPRSFSTHHTRTSILGKALSVSVLNQVVSSGTNFAVGLYLVRALSPSDYGLYGICFAIILFFAGLGNSLFLTQMVVHTPEKKPHERHEYASQIFFLVTTFCFATLGVVLLLVLLTPTLLAEHRNFIYAVTAASISYLVKEFFVRHAYNVQKEGWALSIHVLLAAVLCVLILISKTFIFKLTVIQAILGYSFAHIVAVFLGFGLAKLPLVHEWKVPLYKVFQECWQGGRWASLTNIVYFMRSHAHTIIVTTFVGPIGIAHLNAARLLVTPAVMLTPALGQVFMPRLAEIRVTSPNKIPKIALLIAGTLLGVALLYSGVLALSLETIAPLVVGNEYSASISCLVYQWCAVTCLLALRNGAEMTVLVLKNFKGLLVVNTISAAVALTAVYILVTISGIIGALFGILLGEVVIIMLMWRMLSYE